MRDQATERVRHNLASERPEARIALAAEFSKMDIETKRARLIAAQEALDDYDPSDLSGETSEDPLLRGHRIRMEETVRILSRELNP